VPTVIVVVAVVMVGSHSDVSGFECECERVQHMACL
jgi:hypothetical protein